MNWKLWPESMTRSQYGKTAIQARSVGNCKSPCSCIFSWVHVLKPDWAQAGCWLPRTTRGTETLGIRFSFLGFAFVPCQLGFKCWPVAISHTGNYFWRMRSLPLHPVFFCFHWCLKQLLTGPERRLCYEHWRLLQRTHVRFPATTWLQTTHSFTSRGAQCTYMANMHTSRQNTHTQEINLK